VWGRFDGIAPPKNSECLAQRLPHAELALFEGGHQFLWQDRTADPRIIAFLERTMDHNEPDHPMNTNEVR
jgi:3-oxoadipate enol-lactonase